MLSFIPSLDSQTIAFEIIGQVTKEDLLKLKNVIEEQFPGEQSFNALAILQQAKLPTVAAIVEEVKIDLKHWGQYNKLAVISEKNILEKVAELGDFLPGIKSRHFHMEEIDQAWDWLKE